MHQKCLILIGDGSWCDLFKEKAHSICQDMTEELLMGNNPIIYHAFNTDTLIQLWVKLFYFHCYKPNFFGLKL